MPAPRRLKSRKLLVASLGVAAVSYVGCTERPQIVGNLAAPPPDNADAAVGESSTATGASTTTTSPTAPPTSPTAPTDAGGIPPTSGNLMPPPPHQPPPTSGNLMPPPPQDAGAAKPLPTNKPAPPAVAPPTKPPHAGNLMAPPPADRTPKL